MFNVMIQTMQVGVMTDIELPRSFVHYSTIVGAIPINVSFWGRKGFASMLSSWEKQSVIIPFSQRE